MNQPQSSTNQSNRLLYTPRPNSTKFSPISPLNILHPGKNYRTQTEFERASYKNYSSNPSSTSRFATAHTNVSAPREISGDYREIPLTSNRTTTPDTTSTPREEETPQVTSNPTEEEGKVSGTTAGGIGYIANSLISGVTKEAETENNPTPANSVGQGSTLDPRFYDSPAPQGLLNARYQEAKDNSESINLGNTLANAATGAAVALI